MDHRYEAYICPLRGAEYQNIEVEDDAGIIAEYENGATGTFVTSTGEYPGTNRLEISGTRGKAVVENGKLTFEFLEDDLRNITKDSKESSPHAALREEVIVQTEPEPAHLGILRNFADAIENGAPLIAPGIEGINELSIANAAYLSYWENAWIDLPLDADRYAAALAEKQKTSHIRAKSSDDEDTVSGEYSSRWKVRW